MSDTLRHGVLAEHLREADLAADLGVAVRTLRRWHAMRTGPRRTIIARRVYYAHEDVQRWLDQQREDATQRTRGAA